jgi:hypothetical protein
MARVWIFTAAALALVPVAWGWRHAQLASDETVVESKPRPPEPAPLCPWREPSLDLQSLFTNATRYEAETRILSGLRPELTQRLGRPPSSEENALHVYRVYEDSTPLGAVLVRRVKGEYGAIELVLATDTEQRVRAWRLQRLREPDAIAAALQDAAWQSSFSGKRASDAWRLGEDIPDVVAQARPSAGAVVEGARSLLILLAASEQASGPAAAREHHH